MIFRDFVFKFGTRWKLLSFIFFFFFLTIINVKQNPYFKYHSGAVVVQEVFYLFNIVFL